MKSPLKTFAVRMVAGINIATILFMLFVGYSDRISPEIYPRIANVGLVFPAFILANFLFLVFWIIFKWRWSVIPFAGFLLCFSPIRTYFPVNLNRSVPDDAIKFISYNVYGFGAGDTLMIEDNPILKYLAEQDADIVCLQEAGCSKKELTAFRDSLLGGIYQYSDTVWQTRSGEAFAIYTKYPILKKDKINFNSEENGCCSLFWLKIGSDTVIVMSNHLRGTGLTNTERSDFKNIVESRAVGDSTERKTLNIITRLDSSSMKRAPQAERLAQFVREHKGKSILLCGDFNDHPISYCYRTIANELIDCFVESGTGAGISYHKNALLVRIDHLFCTPDFIPYQCHIDKSVTLSDHYPLVCWLKKR